MKSRILYFAAAAGFLAGAVVEFLPPRNSYAAGLDVVAAAIFLLLGVIAKP
jgi:hypothetical protein